MLKLQCFRKRKRRGVALINALLIIMFCSSIAVTVMELAHYYGVQNVISRSDQIAKHRLDQQMNYTRRYLTSLNEARAKTEDPDDSSKHMSMIRSGAYKKKGLIEVPEDLALGTNNEIGSLDGKVGKVNTASLGSRRRVYPSAASVSDLKDPSIAYKPLSHIEEWESGGIKHRMIIETFDTDFDPSDYKYNHGSGNEFDRIPSRQHPDKIMRQRVPVKIEGDGKVINVATNQPFTYDASNKLNGLEKYRKLTKWSGKPSQAWVIVPPQKVDLDPRKEYFTQEYGSYMIRGSIWDETSPGRWVLSHRKQIQFEQVVNWGGSYKHYSTLQNNLDKIPYGDYMWANEDDECHQILSSGKELFKFPTDGGVTLNQSLYSYTPFFVSKETYNKLLNYECNNMSDLTPDQRENCRKARANSNSDWVALVTNYDNNSSEVLSFKKFLSLISNDVRSLFNTSFSRDFIDPVAYEKSTSQASSHKILDHIQWQKAKADWVLNEWEPGKEGTIEQVLNRMSLSGILQNYEHFDELLAEMRSQLSSLALLQNESLTCKASGAWSAESSLGLKFSCNEFLSKSTHPDFKNGKVSREAPGVDQSLLAGCQVHKQRLRDNETGMISLRNAIQDAIDKNRDSIRTLSKEIGSREDNLQYYNQQVNAECWGYGDGYDTEVCWREKNNACQAAYYYAQQDTEIQRLEKINAQLAEDIEMIDSKIKEFADALNQATKRWNAEKANYEKNYTYNTNSDLSSIISGYRQVSNESTSNSIGDAVKLCMLYPSGQHPWRAFDGLTASNIPKQSASYTGPGRLVNIVIGEYIPPHSPASNDIDELECASQDQTITVTVDVNMCTINGVPEYEVPSFNFLTSDKCPTAKFLNSSAIDRKTLTPQKVFEALKLSDKKSANIKLRLPKSANEPKATHAIRTSSGSDPFYNVKSVYDVALDQLRIRPLILSAQSGITRASAAKDETVTITCGIQEVVKDITVTHEYDIVEEDGQLKCKEKYNPLANIDPQIVLKDPMSLCDDYNLTVIKGVADSNVRTVHAKSITDLRAALSIINILAGQTFDPKGYLDQVRLNNPSSQIHQDVADALLSGYQLDDIRITKGTNNNINAALIFKGFGSNNTIIDTTALVMDGYYADHFIPGLINSDKTLKTNLRVALPNMDRYMENLFAGLYLTYPSANENAEEGQIPESVSRMDDLFNYRFNMQTDNEQADSLQARWKYVSQEFTTTKNILRHLDQNLYEYMYAIFDQGMAPYKIFSVITGNGSAEAPYSAIADMEDTRPLARLAAAYADWDKENPRWHFTGADDGKFNVVDVIYFGKHTLDSDDVASNDLDGEESGDIGIQSIHKGEFGSDWQWGKGTYNIIPGWPSGLIAKNKKYYSQFYNYRRLPTSSNSSSSEPALDVLINARQGLLHPDSDEELHRPMEEDRIPDLSGYKKKAIPYREGFSVIIMKKNRNGRIVGRNALSARTLNVVDPPANTPVESLRGEPIGKDGRKIFAASMAEGCYGSDGKKYDCGTSDIVFRSDPRTRDESVRLQGASFIHDLPLYMIYNLDHVDISDEPFGIVVNYGDSEFISTQKPGFNTSAENIFGFNAQEFGSYLNTSDPQTLKYAMPILAIKAGGYAPKMVRSSNGKLNILTEHITNSQADRVVVYLSENEIGSDRNHIEFLDACISDDKFLEEQVELMTNSNVDLTKLTGNRAYAMAVYKGYAPENAFVNDDGSVYLIMSKTHGRMALAPQNIAPYSLYSFIRDIGTIDVAQDSILRTLLTYTKKQHDEDDLLPYALSNAVPLRNGRMLLFLK